MSRHITITTPEGVAIEYNVAGVGTRFLALLVDTLLQAFIMLLLVLGFVAVVSIGSYAWSEAPWWAYAGLLLSLFLVFEGYFVAFEALWNGQTPGKRAVGLRVVREGGFPLDFRGAVIRNLLRIVDFLPSGYLVGVCMILFHAESRRVGDIAAGTLVIREREAGTQAGYSFGGDVAAPAAPLIGLDSLTPQHYEVMETFLRRRHEMAPSLRHQMSEQIGWQIRGALPDAPREWSGERLMEEILRERARRIGL